MQYVLQSTVFSEFHATHISQFISEVNASRSTAIYNACLSAPIIFASLNLPADLWARNAGTSRKDSPAFQRLLQFPGEENPKTLVPLYYPDLRKTPSLLFMTENLTNVSRLIVAVHPFNLISD